MPVLLHPEQHTGYKGQSEPFAEELYNMRLVIALALFLGLLGLACSAPHANSEALLQELRNALNEKEVKQQIRPAEALALLCEPMATGVAIGFQPAKRRVRTRW